jgi:hypothetical protein
MARSRNSQPDTFIAYVEMHERQWGTNTYPGKPSLADLLSAEVVVFWYPPKENRKSIDSRRMTVSTYKTIDEFSEHYGKRLISRDEPSPLTPFRIYANKRRMDIAGIRVTLREHITRMR